MRHCSEGWEWGNGVVLIIEALLRGNQLPYPSPARGLYLVLPCLAALYYSILDCLGVAFSLWSLLCSLWDGRMGLGLLFIALRCCEAVDSQLLAC